MKHLFATIFTALAVVTLVAPCGEAKGRKHNVKKQHKKTAVRYPRVREITVVEDNFVMMDERQHVQEDEVEVKCEEPIVKREYPIYIEKRIIEEKNEDKKEEKKETNEIYKAVEQLPQFPGGDAALLKYVSSHINYPAAAKENKVEGRTILQFVVEKNGKVGEVKVAKSAGDRSLDMEAIRIVKTLPAFIPAQNGGVPVRFWYTLPVTFKLKNKR